MTRKEKMLNDFLDILRDNAFISENFTGREEKLKHDVIDNGAIININAQFDREDLENILVDLIKKEHNFLKNNNL